MKTFTIEEKSQIETIINQCKVCYLGMIDNDQSPYVVPMNFGYKNNIFYLHSGPDGKNIQLLNKNKKVCLTFNSGENLIYQHPNVACSYSMVSKSVICKGTIAFVENYEEKVEALNILMEHYTDKKFSYSAPAVNNVRILKLLPDEITCKSFGNSIRNRNF